MSINLGLLTRDNFEKIIDIQKSDGFDHSYYLDVERLKRLAQRGEVFYGIYLIDDLIGFIGLDIEIRAKLHFFSINKDFQRNGYGTKAFAQIMNILKQKNIKKLYVYTESGSLFEIFLEKQGFNKVGFYKNRFSKNRDANIFELNLT